MKGKLKGKLVTKLMEHRRIVRTGCGLMAAAVLLSGGFYIIRSSRDAGPALPVIVDGGNIVINDEEVPLAQAPTVQKLKPVTKKTVKKVKLKKASDRTYTKSLGKKIETKTTTANYPDKTVKTVVKTTTNTAEKYKKNGKIKRVVTTVKTETTIITTMKEEELTLTSETARMADTDMEEVRETSVTSNVPVRKTLAAAAALPKADANVRDAFVKLGFTLQVDSTVGYTGKFNASTRSITMRKEGDDAVYHELGHFLMFLYLGNAENDGGADGKSAYAAEQGLYNGVNKAYVNQNASEYLAESYHDYCLDKAGLKARRPQTYALIEKAVSMVDDALIAKYQKIYGSIWK